MSVNVTSSERVFPARAGMSPYLAAHNPDDSSFPRASGDEPVRKALNVLAFVFSPRERG